MIGHLPTIKMNARLLALEIMFIILNIPAEGQTPQGFYLDSWQPRFISDPAYTDVPQVSGPVTVSVTIDFNDTITKISRYVFGSNANVYTGCMSDNKDLMKNIANLGIGLLRGPSGSISDVFFWNRNINEQPDDVPPSMLKDLWYGDRPYSWENWTMAVDSFYSVLGKVNATGMLTVNYGYARYGTGITPVANAAHMAAEWVRYDNGRTKFWEIGNEVSGSWEAGYRIDPALNKDGQPEYINGTLYGKQSLIFIDSMKAAAKETGADIKIGLVMCEEYSSANASWNKDVAAQAGEKADFYVVHSYFTPYNQNSDVETILSSPAKTASYKTYVWGELDKAGKPHLPVALTEYNIFAVGSKQAVSHVNGMHAILVINEAVKNGFGAALRWDLANGWNNGDDHGMFSSGDEPGIVQYSPRPVFFDLYYFQKYTGDVLLNSLVNGDSKIVVIPTAFSSGQVGTVIVNTGRTQQITRLNLKNFRYGDRYFTYTLTGTPNTDFSRKVFINGVGNNLDAGGPENYERIFANSSLISDEIRIYAPPLSVTFVLIQPGNKELPVNDSIVGLNDVWEKDKIRISPNPTNDQFTVFNIPSGINAIEIISISGEVIYHGEITGDSFQSKISRSNLASGVYILQLKGKGKSIVKKLIVN